MQGSDQADSANVQRLRDKGIECFVGHAAENLGDAEVVVVSTAIKKTNPELKAAREKLLPIVRRAEMLAELMRFRQAVAIGGTHGKTTTTSMVATLLDAGGLDPTVINGGIINAYGTNARMGDGEWMVVEADESDGTFLKLPADIAVVTNIDPGASRPLRHVRQGARGVPPIRRERAVLRLRRHVHRPSGSAGAGRPHRGSPRHHLWRERAGRRALHEPSHGRCGVADSTWSSATARRGIERAITDLRLPMPGRHNVSNATAAIAVAHELGISADEIRKGLVVLRRRQAPLHA